MEFHSPLYLYFLFKFLFIPYVKEFHKHLLDILGRLICDYLLYFFYFKHNYKEIIHSLLLLISSVRKV